MSNTVEVFNPDTGLTQKEAINSVNIGYNAIEKKYEYIKILKNKGLKPYLTNINPSKKEIEIEWDHSYSTAVRVVCNEEAEVLEHLNNTLSYKKELLKNITDLLQDCYEHCFNDYVSWLKYKGHCPKYSKMYITNKPKFDEKYQHFFNEYLEESEFIKKNEAKKAILQKEIVKLQDDIRKRKLGNTFYFKGYCKNFYDAKKLGFEESYMVNNGNLDRGVLVYKNDPQLLFDTSILKTYEKKGTIGYKRSINYNANNESSVFHKTIYNYYSPWENSLRDKYTKNNYHLANLLKGLTFGFEIETSFGGLMRDQDLDALGLIPLKDGSINSYEYATVPLGYKANCSKDDRMATFLSPDVKELTKDLRVLQIMLETLNEYTKTDQYCSLHIHVGNTGKDKPFLIAFYMLCYMIQEELFSFQPEYKQDAPKYIGAKKNYCKKIPDLELFKEPIFSRNNDDFKDKILNNYNNIFKFLSNGESLGPKYNRVCKNHPLGKKWERTERYNWINVVNTVFNKEETIEFRLHSGTTNPQKVINWLLICNAIIKYAEKNVKEILSLKKGVSLNDVLEGYCTEFSSKKRRSPYGCFIYEYLTQYIHERKQYFETLRKKGDVKGVDEFIKDKTYMFKFINHEGQTITTLIEKD